MSFPCGPSDKIYYFLIYILGDIKSIRKNQQPPYLWGFLLDFYGLVLKSCEFLLNIFIILLIQAWRWWKARIARTVCHVLFRPSCAKKKQIYTGKWAESNDEKERALRTKAKFRLSMNYSTTISGFSPKW